MKIQKNILLFSAILLVSNFIYIDVFADESIGGTKDSKVESNILKEPLIFHMDTGETTHRFWGGKARGCKY